MERGAQRRKVFLSYRSSDRAVVAEFAERLRRDGVDAWFDHWEIAPGDDIVARMDEGVDGCTAARLGRTTEAAAALESHLQLALDVYQRLPGQVDAVVDLAGALYLTADVVDGDQRRGQSRELLEALEVDQRLPQNGRALLDRLRQDQDPSSRRKT